MALGQLAAGVCAPGGRSAPKRCGAAASLGLNMPGHCRKGPWQTDRSRLKRGIRFGAPLLQCEGRRFDADPMYQDRQGLTCIARNPLSIRRHASAGGGQGQPSRRDDVVSTGPPASLLVKPAESMRSYRPRPWRRRGRSRPLGAGRRRARPFSRNGLGLAGLHAFEEDAQHMPDDFVFAHLGVHPQILHRGIAGAGVVAEQDDVVRQVLP